MTHPHPAVADYDASEATMDHNAISRESLMLSDEDVPRNGHGDLPVRSQRIERFSTTGLSPDERIDLWEQHNARALVALEARSLNGVQLEAAELNLRLDRLQFAHVRANPHVVQRDARQISRTPGENVAFYFTLFGEAFFYDEDGVHLQRPGVLLVCDTSRPFMRGFASGLQEFVITVPQPLFEQLAESRAPQRPVTMGFTQSIETNPHAGQLARLVRASLQGSDEEIATAESRALDLIREIFSADAQRAASSYRLAALAYIDRHLGDPNLSPAEVASHVGISERHMSRIFGETGVGPARVILDKRLEEAHRLLSMPNALTVGAAAKHCGFSSHAHFSRVFREKFEETPTHLRARTRTA
ncbi:helix-turn-helix transcriptional regulator [Microbacterium aurantiacum]|uniref:helix-turn-helix transcriptional regulator n=1 Tax=Microbacterium aurantiacum TaxID=162393 RepID=UPI0040358CDD